MVRVNKHSWWWPKFASGWATLRNRNGSPPLMRSPRQRVPCEALAQLYLRLSQWESEGSVGTETLGAKDIRRYRYYMIYLDIYIYDHIWYKIYIYIVISIFKFSWVFIVRKFYTFFLVSDIFKDLWSQRHVGKHVWVFDLFLGCVMFLQSKPMELAS